MAFVLRLGQAVGVKEERVSMFQRHLLCLKHKLRLDTLWQVRHYL